MSLKCSIFGHKYTEPDVERERDEQGSEVVITIRELESCERCGHTRVVSENKEVTTLETPDVGAEGAAPDDEPAAEAPSRGSMGDEADDAGTVEGSAHADVAEATDAEIIDEEPVPDAEGGSVAGGSAEGAAQEGDHHPADEVIQDAGGSGGQAGEADQEQDGVDEDDGVILESDAEGVEPESRQPGEWPQDSGDEQEPDWVSETEHTAPTVDDGGPDIESAGSAVTVPEGEFFCGECGFTTEVESSSLRAGDFCPECHQGTLDHRSGGA
jgi:hypothetical protein